MRRIVPVGLQCSSLKCAPPNTNWTTAVSVGQVTDVMESAGRDAWTLACYHSAGVPMQNMSAVVQQLKKERVHVQQQLQRIDEALAALGSSSNGARTMSAAGRRRISLAQKARWAKHKAKPKRTISAAGRKRIAAAQRARWAKVKRAA